MQRRSFIKAVGITSVSLGITNKLKGINRFTTLDQIDYDEELPIFGFYDSQQKQLKPHQMEYDDIIRDINENCLSEKFRDISIYEIKG